MYRIDGQYFPCHSKSTQLAFFQSVVSTGASFKPLDISCISKKPTHSMHLVLGTHYDKVSDATLKEKEEILKSSMSSLESYLQNCIIHHKKSIIFPVNTIGGSEERAKYSDEICEAIWYRGSDASLKIKIPIRWFAFELSLPEQSIVSVKEALSIGERYGMNEEDTKQALRYFHNVSLMLYYPVVMNVVFIDSKPILEILSQLLALTYVTDKNARALILIKPVSLSVANNLKEGFFNEDIFEHLKSKLRLLLHLNIITEVRKGHYFIPYALPSYNESVSTKETNAKPLLIVWREEESEEILQSKQILPVPTGLFPLTIVHLLNQKECVTEFPPSAPQYHKFRDAMSLKIKITSKHLLHLINRYTHIEVYFTGPTQHCPLVCKLLTTAIDNSSDAMHLKHNYVNAFACPNNESCYCIVNEGYHKVADCTVCGESPALSNDYWTWFNDAQGPAESNNGTQTEQVHDQSSYK
uniref:C-terminal of Roc (COR) domain-containing protein n=1 Tax=Amphimedon queenslandica TaxID=400682 RepID=A0A1X7SU43_AMPQE